MKVDGRKLRRDINTWISLYYPNYDPKFTVRSVSKTEWYKDKNILEVRFSEVDDDACEIWAEVANYVTNEWWPKHSGQATMSKKVWAGLYRPWTSVDAKIDDVEVGLWGWMHNGE